MWRAVGPLGSLSAVRSVAADGDLVVPVVGEKDLDQLLQLFHVEGLGERGGHVVPFGDGEDVALAGCDDDRGLLSLLDIPGDPLLAAHAGQIEIEEDEIGARGLGEAVLLPEKGHRFDPVTEPPGVSV